MKKTARYFWSKIKFVLNIEALLVLIFFVFTASLFLFSSKPAEGNVTIYDPISGFWQGNLGMSAPPSTNFGNDVASPKSNAEIFYLSPGNYEVKIIDGATDAWIISSEIKPGDLVSWKQVQPVTNDPDGSDPIKFDVVCGSNTSGCGATYDEIPGWEDKVVPDPDTGATFIDLSTLPTTIKSIRIKAKWHRTAPANPSASLLKWAVTWDSGGGVNLFITHSSPTSPVAHNSSATEPPSDYRQYDVTYTLNYASNLATTLHIELAYPEGLYSYDGGVAYKGSKYVSLKDAGGGNNLGDKVTWDFEVDAMTAGSKTVVFTINTGPPDGTLFTTTGFIRNDLGTTVNRIDYMTVTAKSYTRVAIAGPGKIAPSTLVRYMIIIDNNSGYPWQGDIYGLTLTFTPSPCTPTFKAFHDDPDPGAGGATASWDGTKLTINVGNLVYPAPVIDYIVEFQSGGTCGGTVDSSLTVSNQQIADGSYVKDKSASHSATFTAEKDITMAKDTWDDPTNLGARISYFMYIRQNSNVPVSGFYGVDMVPEGTNFENAGLVSGDMVRIGFLPNNFKIYVSDAPRSAPGVDGYPSTMLSPTDSSWRECVDSNHNNYCDLSEIPFSGNVGSPPLYNTNVHWVKWANSSLEWDVSSQGTSPIANLSVIVKDSGLPSSISNRMRWGDDSGWINAVDRKVAIDDRPWFTLAYGGGSDTTGDGRPDTNYIQGNEVDELVFYGQVMNAEDYDGRSTGDAKNVVVKMYLPKNPEYLWPSADPIISATAKCVNPTSGVESTNCPDGEGGSATIPSGVYHFGALPGDTSYITWDIPIIYTSSRAFVDSSKPFAYRFYVKTKISKGHTSGETASCNEPGGGYDGPGNIWRNDRYPIPNTDTPPAAYYDPAGTCVLRVSGTAAGGETVRRQNPLGVPVKINVDISMVVGKEPPDNPRLEVGLDIEDPGLTYTLSLENNGSGAIYNWFIIDNIPYNDSYDPMVKAQFFDADGPNADIYWMSDSDWKIDAEPPKTSNPAWKLISDDPPADKSEVAWVMWIMNPVSRVPIAVGTKYEAHLTVKASTDMPSGITLENTAVGGWVLPDGTDNIVGGKKPSTIEVINPGFIQTTGGNVGAKWEISMGRSIREYDPPGPPTPSNTDFLGIANKINPEPTKAFFFSAKNWLVDNYTFSTNFIDPETDPLKVKDPGFDDFWDGYGGKGTPCKVPPDTGTGAANYCFYSSGGIKTFNGSMNFETSTSPPGGTYTGSPLILLIDGDLTITKDIKIAPNTGIIFAVKGKVTVGSTVKEIAGLFLIRDNFETKSVTVQPKGQQIGMYAAISYVSRFTPPRIVYMAGDDVRYIRCNDVGCTTTTKAFLTTVDHVSNISITTNNLNSQYAPRIVVGQGFGSGGRTFYIDCKDDSTCADRNISEFNSAWFPDLTYFNKKLYLSYGLSQASPDDNKRLSAQRTCITRLLGVGSYFDCLGGAESQIDNGTKDNGGLPADMGNDTQIGYDPMGCGFSCGFNLTGPVVLYVKHAGSESYLYSARINRTGTGNCSPGSNWNCNRIQNASSEPKKVGRFPSMAIRNNGSSYTEMIAYNDKSDNSLRYLTCDAPSAALVNCPNPTIVKVPVQSGVQVLDKVSLKLTSSRNPRIAYNYSYDDSGTTKYGVGFAYCDGACNDPDSWAFRTIIDGVESGSSGDPGLQIYNKGLELTADLSIPFDNTRRFPIFVIHRATIGDLLYVRCRDMYCDPALEAPGSPNPIVRSIDSGSGVVLADDQLTVNGSVIAFKSVTLSRNLLSQNNLLPGETFNFEPRYYYIFKGLLNSIKSFSEVEP
ncbi:MAG: hypothetical protein A2172_01580 [Candidatus Woykebacteria bacterium RBG_13_40_15]|uniref:Uncharacterized protein n=1 Tax=Candidatus Woykebacteria bacterium RBG_13_40_15 TaxID=1802593 RepID=A0A1G1W5E5_9BACT|nr:MAG: hypothetical protein A2172_01580 [Candidatus Woykebacteria bacterium RBG_13_40_15]